MMIIKGQYAAAHVFTDNIEPEAIKQIEILANSVVTEGSSIAIMPDVHAGKGCTIGTVMTISDKVVPNLVGVDIACGVLAICIGNPNMEIDFEKLQQVINEHVPSGFNIREEALREMDYEQWKMPVTEKEADYFDRSIGTLGGGNHFISIEVGLSGTWLLIHTGSRKFGGVVAKFYQDKAVQAIKKIDNQVIIEQLKFEGRANEIEGVLKQLNEGKVKVDNDLAYLTGVDKENYLHDMALTQRYANLNRRIIATTITNAMGWYEEDVIISVHNYIDVEAGILRKGAVAARKDEYFLVPLNMKDGTLIYHVQEERPDWLFSAPHGAGRTMSRRRAKEELSMEEFTEEMKEIWSDSVVESTLDEAPAAYKPAQEIEDILSEVYVKFDHLKPVFNFKAKE